MLREAAEGPKGGIWVADFLEIFGCVCPLLLRLTSDRIDPGCLELSHSGSGDVVAHCEFMLVPSQDVFFSIRVVCRTLNAQLRSTF